MKAEFSIKASALPVTVAGSGYPYPCSGLWVLQWQMLALILELFVAGCLWVQIDYCCRSVARRSPGGGCFNSEVALVDLVKRNVFWITYLTYRVLVAVNRVYTGWPLPTKSSRVNYLIDIWFDIFRTWI